MAISRMDMERQLRAGGGIMTLEEPRQGYFLGKIVRKAKKAVKKVVKSPVGKLALGAAALKFGGPMLAKAFPKLQGSGFLSGRFMGDGGIFSAAKGLFDKGNLLSGLVRNPDGTFNLGRAALSGLGATAIAAPFFMGGDEEEVDEVHHLLHHKQVLKILEIKLEDITQTLQTLHYISCLLNQL